MAGDCRLHAHSRGQDVVALSSCEAELYAASEAVKEAIVLKELLAFAALGDYRLELLMDAPAAKQFLFRRGCGRMKHIDARVMWLQDLVANAGLQVKKVDRLDNVSDMLTHTPTASDLERFIPKLGMANLEGEFKQLTSASRPGFKAAAKKVAAILGGEPGVDGSGREPWPTKHMSPVALCTSPLDIRIRKTKTDTVLTSY